MSSDSDSAKTLHDEGERDFYRSQCSPKNSSFKPVAPPATPQISDVTTGVFFPPPKPAVTGGNDLSK